MTDRDFAKDLFYVAATEQIETVKYKPFTEPHLRPQKLLKISNMTSRRSVIN